MQAIGHSLAGGAGISLSDFKASRPPLPSSKNQRRYFVASKDIPPSSGSSFGHPLRCCVVDDRTGARSTEVKWKKRRCLFECLDCGPIGWPARYWMYSCVGGRIRGTFVADPCHVRHNRYQSALTAAGCWPIFLDGAILVGLRKGPWSGAAHYATLREVSANYAQSADSSDPLFAQVCNVTFA